MDTQINTGSDLGAINGAYSDAYKSADRLDKQTEEGIKKMDSEAVPKPPTLSESPKPENYNRSSMEAFGSAASFLAMFGSLMTKHPLTTALNSGAAVMNAYHAQDATSFKEAMDKWKIDNENAFKMADYNQQLYKDVLGKDEAELKARAVSAKDNVMIHMADAKMAQQLYKDREKNLNKMQKEQWVVDAATSDYDQAIKDGKSEKEANQIFMTSYGKYNATLSGKLAKDDQGLGVDWEKMKPNDPVPGTGLTAGAIQIYGDAIKNGANPSQIGLGYGMNPVKKAVDNYIAYKYPDFDMAKSEREYLGAQTEEKITAKNASNINIAVNNLDNSLPLLMEQVQAVNPGQFKSFNQFQNYLSENTGDPKIVKLRQTVNDTLADFSMLLARGGQVTDQVRNSANETLNAAWASGQFKGAVEIMYRTGQNQKAAAKQSLQEAGGAGAGRNEKVENLFNDGGSKDYPLTMPSDMKDLEQDKYYTGPDGNTGKYVGIKNGHYQFE